jgi:hypothetical protein
MDLFDLGVSSLQVRETGSRRRNNAMPSNRGKPTMEIYRPPSKFANYNNLPVDPRRPMLVESHLDILFGA